MSLHSGSTHGLTVTPVLHVPTPPSLSWDGGFQNTADIWNCTDSFTCLSAVQAMQGTHMAILEAHFFIFFWEEVELSPPSMY